MGGTLFGMGSPVLNPGQSLGWVGAPYGSQGFGPYSSGVPQHLLQFLQIVPQQLQKLEQLEYLQQQQLQQVQQLLQIVPQQLQQIQHAIHFLTHQASQLQQLQQLTPGQQSSFGAFAQPVTGIPNWLGAQQAGTVPQSLAIPFQQTPQFWSQGGAVQSGPVM